MSSMQINKNISDTKMNCVTQKEMEGLVYFMLMFQTNLQKQMAHGSYYKTQLKDLFLSS